MKLPIIAAAFLLALSAASAAHAEFGGSLQFGDTGKVKLTSYSWERGDWGPGGRGNKFLGFGRVGAPDTGPGVLAVVTPVKLGANPLRDFCKSKAKLEKLEFRSPVIDDPTHESIEIFVLHDLTVSDCVHAAGAPGEVFHINFAKIEYVTPPRPTCVFGRDC